MDKRLSKLFDKYNKEFFYGELPACEVVWGDLPEDNSSADLGRTIMAEDEETGQMLCRIVLSNGLKLQDWPRIKEVLLHECIHLKLYPNVSHGKKFYDEIVRLAIAGAYKGIL